LLSQFPDPGSPQLEEVSDTFFFGGEGTGRSCSLVLSVRTSWLQELKCITVINILPAARAGKWKDDCCRPGKSLMWKEIFLAQGPLGPL